MKTTFIYALCEPETRTVRYIGKANEPEKRFKSHVQKSVRQKNHLGNWLRSLQFKNAVPDMVILREVEYDKWQEAEERYIRLARGCGMRLVNSTDGGEGITITPEILKKIVAKNTGKKRTPEQCAAISARQIGKDNPMFGKEVSLETRAKMSASRAGEKNHVFGTTRTPETRAKISAALSGEKHPLFGKKHSLESRALMSKNMRGLVRSAEGRANNKAAQRLRAQKELAAKVAADPEFGTRPHEIERAKRTAVQRAKREKEGRQKRTKPKIT